MRGSRICCREEEVEILQEGEMVYDMIPAT